MTDRQQLNWLARTPYSVAAYLRAHGWQMLGATSDESLWSLDADGGTWEALLPSDAERSDALRRVSELLSVLSAVEKRSVDELMRDIRTAQSDVIRIRVVPETDSGTAPIEDALRIVSASRELLLAAAAAVDSPRAVLAPRKPDKAIDFLRSVRLSTEPGSFIVALEAPVDADLDGPHANTATTNGPVVFVPFGRQVTELLMRAIDGSLRSCAEVAAGQELSVFDDTVQGGVSANFLESLARIGSANSLRQEFREFSLSVRWSYNRPGPELRQSYVITRDAIPVFSAAAASLRARRPEPDVTLIGQIVALRRDDAAETDTVTLSAYIGSGDAGRVRSVRVVLDDPGHHQLVSRAYETRDLLEISGDLQPSGYALTMQNVSRLKIVHPDESERPDRTYRGGASDD